MAIKHEARIRLPIHDKAYWQNQLEMFCKYFDESKVKYISFGKQDMRGAYSIAIFDERGRELRQLHFNQVWELLGYVKGFNEARSQTWNTFNNFMQEAA